MAFSLILHGFPCVEAVTWFHTLNQLACFFEKEKNSKMKASISKKSCSMTFSKCMVVLSEAGKERGQVFRDPRAGEGDCFSY